VDNQPAHYYKKTAGKKPGTKKKDDTSGQKSRVKTTGAKRTGEQVRENKRAGRRYYTREQESRSGYLPLSLIYSRQRYTINTS
jgi:hypothetical protein